LIFSSIASSLYVAGIPDIAAAFNISPTVALLGLSLYVLGLAFGPVLAAPISETRGRRAVYRVCLVLFSAFIASSGLSRTFASFAVCRFFAGFFGGSVLSVISGTNADVWTPLERAPSAALMALSTAMGPSLGMCVFSTVAKSSTDASRQAPSSAASSPRTGVSPGAGRNGSSSCLPP
jgi:MFS family permease